MLNKLRQLTSTGEQDNCRQFYLQTDKAHAKVGILLFSIPLLAFAYNDVQFISSPMEFISLICCGGSFCFQHPFFLLLKNCRFPFV
jgi:hypothetical protein